MPMERALAIIAKEVPHALDGDCHDALLEIVASLPVNSLPRALDQSAPVRSPR
jgi:hypothetical protein